MTVRNRKSTSRAFAWLALAAALGLALVPVIAIAHHHGETNAFAESSHEPLQADFDADCALCGQLNLNDGRSLDAPSALWLVPAQAVEATVAFTVPALPATPDRALSIRGPPSKT